MEEEEEGEYPSPCPRQEKGKTGEERGERRRESEKEHVRDAECDNKGTRERQEKMRPGEKNIKKKARSRKKESESRVAQGEEQISERIGDEERE